MTTLAMGANAPISSSVFTLDVHLPPGAQVDVTALLLYSGGKVRGDDDMCFYNQTSIGGGSVSLQPDNHKQIFSFDLSKVDSAVEKIVVNATLDNGVFSSVDGLKISISSGIDMNVDTAGRSEAALILCEIYKRNEQWKVRNVSQGFNGGLQALAEHFGVDVAAPESPAPSVEESPAIPAPAIPATPAEPLVAPAAAPKPTASTASVTAAPAVDMSKVSLTKNKSSISLEKVDGKFGRIRVNLNWNQDSKSGGMFGLGKKSIDLDLGAFVESKSGDIAVVQSLGNTFGDLTQPPFTKLMGDDRTGTSTDGEWLEINGDQWSSIRRVLIFAFIYDGAANWQETNGVIRMMVPGQPEIEVRMNELSSNKRDIMCAVALLENDNNQISVNREVRFFGGHEQMDKGYDWGMTWRAGKK